MKNKQKTIKNLAYEQNKAHYQAYQREYEANKRKEIKKKLDRLEMLEAYLEQQGILI